jgi:hypothetical protein
MWVEQSYKHVKHELGWSQYQERLDRAMRRHWQLVCCAFSHLVVSCQSFHCERDARGHLSRKCLHSKAFLPQRQERGKKISEEQEMRPQLSWPRALRAVRGWLEPWIMLRRYWRGWSQLPLPPALQLLLRWLERGYAISLYSSA